MAPSSLDKGHVEAVENSAGPGSPRGRRSGGRFKRHCAKYWWVHLLITIIITVAVVLGISFGVFPHLAQKAIDDSTLTVQNISITNPAPNNFIYGQNATITGKVPVTSHLDPQSLAMYLYGGNSSAPVVPFMYLNVSRKDLKSSFPVDVSNYPMQVTNLDAFIAFSSALLGQKSLQLGLQSRPELWAGALHKYVNYNKIVNLTGFNSFSGITLSNATILSTPDADGTNMLTTLLIPNPTEFTIQVGNMTSNFAMAPLGNLGYGVVEDLTLVPGDNHLTVRAVLTKDAYALVPLSLKTPGSLNITISGNSTVFNGQSIPWLQTPLNALPLTVPLITGY